MHRPHLAKWVAEDVAGFLRILRRRDTRDASGRSADGGAGRTLCVSLIGMRAAPNEANARHGVYMSWAADAQQMLASIRRLEHAGGAFSASYVVGDGAFPEDEALLLSELRAVPYQGFVTARRFGAVEEDRLHQADLRWVRDMAVCSQVDVFVSNDVPGLLDGDDLAPPTGVS